MTDCWMCETGDWQEQVLCSQCQSDLGHLGNSPDSSWGPRCWIVRGAQGLWVMAGSEDAAAQMATEGGYNTAWGRPVQGAINLHTALERALAWRYRVIDLTLAAGIRSIHPVDPIHSRGSSKHYGPHY